MDDIVPKRANGFVGADAIERRLASPVLKSITHEEAQSVRADEPVAFVLIDVDDRRREVCRHGQAGGRMWPSC